MKLKIICSSSSIVGVFALEQRIEFMFELDAPAATVEVVVGRAVPATVVIGS